MLGTRSAWHGNLDRHHALCMCVCVFVTFLFDALCLHVRVGIESQAQHVVRQAKRTMESNNPTFKALKSLCGPKLLEKRKRSAKGHILNACLRLDTADRSLCMHVVVMLQDQHQCQSQAR